MIDLKFHKCHCNGNSFIILNDNYINLTSSQIKKSCQDNLTDGLIIIDSKENIPKINYFNNDGSWETFCLNGLACVAMLFENIYNINVKNIECNKIIYPVKINNCNEVIVTVPEPVYIKKNIIVENYKGNYIDSGAKHFVINFKKQWMDKKQIKKLSQKIRFNAELFPEGINVNYYKEISDNTIEVKTYEKGIESLMDSCASGSYACAYEYSIKKNINNKINVLNDGGNFSIMFNENYNKNTVKVKSHLEYSGVLKINEGNR